MSLPVRYSQRFLKRCAEQWPLLAALYATDTENLEAARTGGRSYAAPRKHAFLVAPTELVPSIGRRGLGRLYL